MFVEFVESMSSMAEFYSFCGINMIEDEMEEINKEIPILQAH